MSDVEPDFDDEYDPEDDESGEGAEAPAQASSFGRTYEDLPEGWVTAGGFAKVLENQRSVKVRPQVIYATAKSSKTFPAKHHTDGRIIVPIKEALEWWDEKEQRVKARGGGPRSTEPTAWEKAEAARAAEEAAANA